MFLWKDHLIVLCNKDIIVDEKKEGVIGFTAGSFDCTHTGHYLMFEDCKRHCTYLIVGLQTDPTIDRPDKNKPVQSVFERYIQLRACKFIDEIIVYSTEDELYTILSTLEIDIRFLGDDWRGREFTGYELPVYTHFNSRTHDYSTTNLRNRIYESGGK